MLTCDDYLSPRTLDEAFDAMERHRGAYRLIAGATDILPWAREGRAGDVHIPVLIDIAGIPDLNVREIGAGTVRLGGATRFQRFIDDKALMAAMPSLPFCAVWFADDQIRESATIGGNLVNASPAADGTPALLVHDAAVVLASRRSGRIERRKMTLVEFMQGPGKTALGEEEILLEVECAAEARRCIREGWSSTLAGDLDRLCRGARRARSFRREHERCSAGRGRRRASAAARKQDRGSAEVEKAHERVARGGGCDCG
jgi:carbon-monoxide dehydrogenase medium subunit/xanthine dehydrogenase FAD-binding subunit